MCIPYIHPAPQALCYPDIKLVLNLPDELHTYDAPLYMPGVAGKGGRDDDARLNHQALMNSLPSVQRTALYLQRQKTLHPYGGFIDSGESSMYTTL